MCVITKRSHPSAAHPACKTYCFHVFPDFFVPDLFLLKMSTWLVCSVRFQLWLVPIFYCFLFSFKILIKFVNDRKKWHQLYLYCDWSKIWTMTVNELDLRRLHRIRFALLANLHFGALIFFLRFQ